MNNISFNKHNTLDTINQWINNCDTKVSILLAMYGVFMTIILSSDIGGWTVNIIKMNICSNECCNIIYICVLLIGLLFLCIGIYKLIRVLIPTINLNHKSIMFFGSVASYKSFNDYYDAVRTFTESDINEDLLHQIYAAAVICNQKFKNQKQGITLSFGGVVVITCWLVTSFFCYYI